MIDDMGIFRTTIAVENPLQPGITAELRDVIVATGSEYTWVPRAVLEALGIGARRRVGIGTTDGRTIERDVGFANVYAGGTSAPDIVVFAEPEDMTLLGARALEGLNLRVDLLTKRLVPAGPVPAASMGAAGYASHSRPIALRGAGASAW